MDEPSSGGIGDGAAGVASAPTRNLLIVHTPRQQDLSDWLKVKQRIEASAPDIEVRIATNESPNSVTRRWQVRRPSLVFSVCPLVEFSPRGGTVCAPPRGHMSKLEQVQRLARQGLSVPPTALLTRALVLDPQQWGRYVVVKPLRGRSGLAVRLLRTEEVAARFAELTLDGRREMAVQPYIEHSQDGYPTEYRVLTLFGRVLYCARNRWGRPRRPLEEIASSADGIIASNDKSFGRVRAVCNDPEIIALGEGVRAFPECPLLGVDIIRATDTGKLYIIEVNPEGYAWHFSSSLARTFTPEHVREIYAQFGALDRVAELLIAKTHAEAAW